MPATRHICHCPETSYGMLPLIIYQEAANGNSEKVLQWLNEGGNINATDMNYRTLVHIACEGNYVHFLKELLKFPDVHLNQGTTLSRNLHGKGNTPLSLAVTKNHVECVEALISSPSKCKIDLINKTLSTGHAIGVALGRNNWKMIEILLKAGLALSMDEATAIFEAAAKSCEEDVVKIIIDRAFPLHSGVINNIVFTILYNNDLWNYVGAEKVFKQCFKNNNYYCFRVLKVAMEKRDFCMVENTLKLLIPNVEININIAKAVLGKGMIEVEESLTQGKLEEGVIYGALFTAAIVGTTDDIAEKLFSLKESYPEDFLKYALLLAALFNRAELLPLLLKDDSFSFSTLSHALRLSEFSKGVGTSLIKRALERISRKTIPLTKDDTE
ncbi:uncharacterized protein LOC135219561 [Macrobrachium nipponense]|uniref:uncharacterized protein LOC135219561 n=1 Tax=Macrobrachium nipponense TaxID=159736 RepID=UPI0030C8999A